MQVSRPFLTSLGRENLAVFFVFPFLPFFFVLFFGLFGLFRRKFPDQRLFDTAVFNLLHMDIQSVYLNVKLTAVFRNPV